MFEVKRLRRAQEVLDAMPEGDDKDAILGALAQLELNPEPSGAWDCGEDNDGKFIYVGNNRKWKITYEMDRADRTVYVHNITKRPSLRFDPR